MKESTHQKKKKNKQKALTINKGIPKAVRHRQGLYFYTITMNSPQMKLIAKLHLNSTKIIYFGFN